VVRKDWKEIVAAGLRNMKQPPVAFVYNPTKAEDGEPFITEICGIPVYYSTWLISSNGNRTNNPVPFFPVFNSEFVWGDEKRFYDACNDY